MTNLLLLGFLPSGSEWIIIALVILLLFGGKKIPELMRGLGKGVKSFKDGVNEAKEEINKAKDERRKNKLTNLADLQLRTKRAQHTDGRNDLLGSFGRTASCIVSGSRSMVCIGNRLFYCDALPLRPCNTCALPQ